VAKRDERGTITSTPSAGDKAIARLAAQYGVVRILAAAKSVDQAAPRVLEAIATNLGWELGAIWWLHRDDEVLRCAATWQQKKLAGADFERISRKTTFKSGTGLPGRVLESRRPAWIVDVTKDGNFKRVKAATLLGLRSAFAFPIRWNEKVTGVIEFFSRETRPPDSELIDAMDSFGTQFGHFVARKRAEEAVRESEALKRAILEAALDCVITMNAKGLIVDFNAAAEETFGYERAAVLGEEMAALIIPPSLREHHRRALTKYLKTEESAILNRRLELIGMRRNGDEFPVELTVTQLAGSQPPLFVGFVRDITARKQAEEERERALQREGEARERSERLVVEALHAEERERRRISETLHDEVLQNLAAVRLSLSQATEGGPELIAEAERELQQTISSLRENIVELHPIVLLHGGLASALEAVAKVAERRGGFRCSVRVDEGVTGLNDDLLLSLARELLSNAVQHSQAQRVAVSIERSGEEIVLSVIDDGRGLATERAKQALCDGHIGLASLEARVGGVGGHVEIRGEEGRGTTVRASVPARRREDDSPSV
jgi:PAS domain S-box-containing protein